MDGNKILKHIAGILICIIIFQYVSMVVPFISINLATDRWEEGTASDGSVWKYILKDGNATNLKCVSFPLNNSGYNDYVTVGDEKVSTSSIYVPSSIDGHTVESLAGAEFDSDEAQKVLLVGKVYIPSTVKEILPGAFAPYNINDEDKPYYNLREIEIEGNGLLTIGNEAFYNCSKLSSINIPESVINIGEKTFQSCSNLKEINISKNVKNIGLQAFEHSGLENINVDKDNKTYSSIDGVLYNKDASELIKYPCGKKGRYIVPSSVVTIKYRSI